MRVKAKEGVKVKAKAERDYMGVNTLSKLGSAAGVGAVEPAEGLLVHVDLLQIALLGGLLVQPRAPCRLGAIFSHALEASHLMGLCPAAKGHSFTRVDWK